MKISIGTQIKKGPWGGGNLFAINLSNFLISRGHNVVNELDDEDIDLILITEPRKTSESSSFTHLDVSKYIQAVKKDCLVVHRINECDERKNTNYVNQYLIEANKVADSTVFVSSWLKNLYLSQGMDKNNKKVILSGANKEIFNIKNFKPWDGVSKIKIVTHHWGSHWNKGFETYLKLDSLLGKQEYKDKLEFTYIGNLPKKIKLTNTRVVSPISGKDLANEIKKNNLYLTGSINEPSGNHHIEGGQCGLPLLYLESGGTIEYSKGYGVGFKEYDFEDKLKYIIKEYDSYASKMKDYPYDSIKMSENYENLFLEMFSSKEKIISERENSYPINLFDLYSYKLSRKLKKINRKEKV